MKSIKTFSIALCAAATMLTFTQCNNAPQQAPVDWAVKCRHSLSKDFRIDNI